MKKIFLSIISLGFALSIFAQDPHLSMFYSAPMQLNPALTGVFNGNYRISGLYRSQWGEVLKKESTSQFRTMTFGADLRIPIGKNSLGVGLEVLNDQAAASDFGTTRGGLAISYMQSLDRWGQHFVVVGIQGDVINRNFNPANLRFGAQWDGATYDPGYGDYEDFLSASNQSKLFFDAGAGLLYFFKGRDNKFTAYAGFAAHHINEPNESLFGGTVTLKRKYVGHAGVNFPIMDQIHLLPKLMIQFQGQSLETLYGLDVRFLFDKFDPSGNAFRFGAMFRGVGGLNAANIKSYNAESIIFMAGIDFKAGSIGNFDFGASYDLNISQQNRSTYSRGGFEISLIYIGKFKKRYKDVTPCPHF